jgi:hypothetical protein
MRTSTETYEHTINGLLQKRREILEEMATTRERLGLLTNDIEAIDRVLDRLGYVGELAAKPLTPRFILFYRGQLRQWLLTQLRENGPATSRKLAERLMQIQQKDSSDRRLMEDIVSRIGKALRHMQTSRIVVGTQSTKRGENVWRLS